MKFPKEYLEEIKQRIKVSDIVGATVQLKRRGREFVGLSPFSKEKSHHSLLMMKRDFIIVLAQGSMEIFSIF
jgi:DNA primase